MTRSYGVCQIFYVKSLTPQQTHLDRERTIIDKGVTVHETVHHHVHHVIQPIIEKESSYFLLVSPLSNKASCLCFLAIDRQTIHTTIPIHEVSHDAPIIHQSQTHNAVPIEHFLQKGGILHNAIPTNDIGSRVLHSGKCTREIDGTADELAKELKLTDSHVRILLFLFHEEAPNVFFPQNLFHLARAGSHYGYD